MEGIWLDEDTDLKSAGEKSFGGSSPSPSAIFYGFLIVFDPSWILKTITYINSDNRLGMLQAFAQQTIPMELTIWVNKVLDNLLNVSIINFYGDSE